MIIFLTEEVEMPAVDTGRISDWVKQVAQLHGMKTGDINYVFCSDDYILKTNRAFLQHDYYTDIITFDYTRGQKISGDLVISLDTVRSNAESIGVDYDKELLRVVIHGILHLCGINDKGPGEREIMEQHENQALALFEQIKSSES